MSDVDQRWMMRAIELAERGRGFVEPNPLVGCLFVRDETVIGEGWHERFGGPHAEVNALDSAATDVRGATAYVSLEPCCHHGKTPPCSEALLDAGVTRVVVAMTDPFEAVAGRGLAQLRSAGIEVTTGVCESAARQLNAPYLKLIQVGAPWMIGKWAMTLDGKIASHTGDSQWISSAASRQIVHQLRGRVDAIMVGRRTAEVDNPRLTARPAGARVATRVVCDSEARLAPDSQLATSAREQPVVVISGPDAPAARVDALRDRGCDVWQLPTVDHGDRLRAALLEMGRRKWTNVLVEGGGELLGSLLDLHQLDEVHAFVAPRLLGGRDAASPFAGQGHPSIAAALSLLQPEWQRVGDDWYVHGHLSRPADGDDSRPPDA